MGPPKRFYQDADHTRRGLSRMTRRVPVETSPHYDLKLSEAAIALRDIHSLRKLDDEARARRVKEIKRAVRNGTYRVDSFRVAECILREEEPDLFE